ncbi:MAG: hypothetical protein JXM73_19415 [Anaerolineae bacterium]|nr:hypothetical protein [Anaerolineae bacterium]
MEQTTTLAQRICEQARQLPETSLLELERYIEFLQFQVDRHQSLKERLARDYDKLAASYEELAGELSDEVWMLAENEALYRVEKDTGL